VEPTSTVMPVATTTAPTVEPTSTAMPVATPVAATATATPEPVATPAEAGGETAEEGFIIGEGSKITFTVEEELRGSPVRFDAVMSSTGLSGTANLGPQPSVVTLDLHSLTSDQSFRDRYVRDRMFPNTPEAVVTVKDLPDLPQSFFEGAEFTGQLEGSLQIGETATPLVFDVTARHDGDVINVLGLTTFTWEQLGIVTPTARSVVYLADEVRVQVLLVAHAP
ncbi:MAG: YceI family protein, partial [Chloroflexota bacterium]|nr:YceI family protein [Chloroflexota bacterium]